MVRYRIEYYDKIRIEVNDFRDAKPSRTKDVEAKNRIELWKMIYAEGRDYRNTSVDWVRPKKQPC